jgi:hypothetical protein
MKALTILGNACRRNNRDTRNTILGRLSKDIRSLMEWEGHACQVFPWQYSSIDLPIRTVFRRRQFQGSRSILAFVSKRLLAKRVQKVQHQ